MEQLSELRVSLSTLTMRLSLWLDNKSPDNKDDNDSHQEKTEQYNDGDQITSESFIVVILIFRL